MAYSPQDRKKELRRNPTNFTARANMGAYRAFLRKKMQEKGTKSKVNVKRTGDKTVTTTDNSLYNVPITKTDLSTSAQNKTKDKVNKQEEKQKEVIKKPENKVKTKEKQSENKPSIGDRTIFDKSEKEAINRKILFKREQMERKLGKSRTKSLQKGQQDIPEFFKWVKENPTQFIAALPVTGGATYLGLKAASKLGGLVGKSKFRKKLTEAVKGSPEFLGKAFRYFTKKAGGGFKKATDSAKKFKKKIDDVDKIKKTRKEFKAKKAQQKTKPKTDTKRRPDFTTDSKGTTRKTKSTTKKKTKEETPVRGDVRDIKKKGVPGSDKPPANAKPSTMDRTTGRFKKQATIKKYQPKDKSQATTKRQREESAVAKRRELNKIERSETTKSDLKKQDRSSSIAQTRQDRLYDQAVRGKGQQFMENAEKMARKEGLDWIKMRGRFMEAFKKEAKQIVTKNTARNQGVKGRSKRQGLYDLDEVPIKLRQVMRNIHNSEKGARKANPKAYKEAMEDRNYKSFFNPKARDIKRTGNVKKAGNRQGPKPGGLLEAVKRDMARNLKSKQFEKQRLFVDNMFKKGKSPLEIKKMMDLRIREYMTKSKKFSDEVDLEKLRTLAAQVSNKLRIGNKTLEQKKAILKAYQQQIRKIIANSSRDKRFD